MNHANETGFILSCLRAFVGKTAFSRERFQREAASGLDWNFIIQTACQHRVFAQMAVVLLKDGGQEGLPGEIRTRLEQGKQFALWDNWVKQKEFGKVNRLFEKDALPVIPLKGLALTQSIYEEEPIRQMSDIDLLFREKDLEKVCHLLVNAGFLLKRSTNHWQQAIAEELIGRAHYFKGELALDVQWSPGFFICKKWVKWDVSRAWAAATSFPSLGPNVRRLSLEDQFEHLLLQLGGDWEREIVSLHQLLDLAMMMKKYDMKGDAVLKKKEAVLAPEQCDRLMGLIQTTQETLLESKPLEEISASSKAIIGTTLKGSASQTKLSSGVAVLSTSIPFRKKLLFLAGYFVPSAEYLGEQYGRGLGNLMRGYLCHQARLIGKTLRILVRQ